SRGSKFLLIGTGAAVVIALLASGLFLLKAHFDLSQERTPLPQANWIIDRLNDETRPGPVAAYWINTASQSTSLPTVMASDSESPVDESFIMGFPAFLLEWADGRLLLIDVGMDEATARSFGAPLETLGLAEPMQPRLSVAESMGPDLNRIQGIVFTHLHIDHVAGLSALCQGLQHRAPVFMSDAQALRPNFLTEEGTDLVKSAPCVDIDRSVAAPMTPLSNFPGVWIVPAAGHTPGSQIIIARVDSGEEIRDLVFVGDIVNAAQAIEINRGKPLLYRTFLVPEDEERQNSLRQFIRSLQTLHGFQAIASHDQSVLETSGLPAWNDHKGVPSTSNHRVQPETQE
ncbi:MAG: MBL fold metallo-hydrolase, partial [Myxococcota bacterium]|nr:MBL fold metallo-hydrolase [Myxococcota bacterium]